MGIKWTCTARELEREWDNYDGDCRASYMHIMDYLAEHCEWVADDEPTLGELAQIYREAWDSTECGGNHMIAGIEAVRNAMRGTQVPVRETPDVEEVAEALHKVAVEANGGVACWDALTDTPKSTHRAEARVAIDMLVNTTATVPYQPPEGVTLEGLRCVFDDAWVVNDVTVSHKTSTESGLDVVLSALQIDLPEPTPTVALSGDYTAEQLRDLLEGMK